MKESLVGAVNGRAGKRLVLRESGSVNSVAVGRSEVSTSLRGLKCIYEEYMINTVIINE